MRFSQHTALNTAGFAAGGDWQSHLCRSICTPGAIARAYHLGNLSAGVAVLLVALFFLGQDLLLLGVASGWGLLLGLVVMAVKGKNPARVTVSPTGVTWRLHGCDYDMPWSDVESFQRLDRKIHSLTQRSFTLRGRDYTLHCSLGMSNYDTLVDLVETYSAQLVQLRKQAALRYGEAAQFGPISLDLEGLTIDYAALSREREQYRFTWSEIREWTVERGHFTLYPHTPYPHTPQHPRSPQHPRGHCIPVPLQAIPDYQAMFNLLADMLTDMRADQGQ